MVRKAESPPQRKALSQVFLRVEWPVHKIVERAKTWGSERVLEIGPGGGILTKALLEAGLNVTAVEKDPRFVEKLKDTFRNHSAADHLTLVEKDILKFDIGNWLAISKASTTIGGNIPYAISTPVLIASLEHLHQVRGICFMVQLEFAQRLAATPDTKAYGSLSVYAQLRAKIEMECKVDRSCFTPVPKVDSAIISLRSKISPVDQKLLSKVELVTRSSFNQRRKILKNAIKNYLTPDLESTCPIDLNRRPETLWPEEFVELAKHLFSV